MGREIPRLCLLRCGGGWRGCELRQILGGDFVRGVFGLPDDFDDVPALAIVDGLDGVDAAGEGLAGEGGFVGAPEMGNGSEGLGLIFELVFGDDFVVVFGDGGDPVVDGEDVGAGGANGDETRVREEELAEAGAVFAGGTGDGSVDGGDELVEGVGGWAGGWGWRWRRRWGLGVDGGEGDGADKHEGEAAHGGSLIERSSLMRAWWCAAFLRGWIGRRRRGLWPG